MVQLHASPAHTATLSGPGNLLALEGTAGQIADGQTLVLSDDGRQYTFEFDRNGQLSDPDHLAITFGANTSPEEMAVLIADTVNATGIGVTANVAGSVVNFLRDDGDGVSFDGVLNKNVVTPVTILSSGPALLDAWIDFNQNGTWDDVGEKILDSVA